MIAIQNRDNAVMQFRYLCKRASRKFLRPGLDRADLEQIAAIGLIKACDRYDSTLKTPFEAFAWLFIVGELMHYVRDHERIVRPPRRLRHLEQRCRAAFDALVVEFGREPQRAELAARLNVNREEIEELYTYRERAVSESLETANPQKMSGWAYTLDERDDYLVLEAALERLTQTERTIVVALYSGGYTQLELAARLGYSRRHISRLHRAALKKMRRIWVSPDA